MHFELVCGWSVEGPSDVRGEGKAFVELAAVLLHVIELYKWRPASNDDLLDLPWRLLIIIARASNHGHKLNNGASAI
jgi:hypothetical protein